MNETPPDITVAATRTIGVGIYQMAGRQQWFFDLCLNSQLPVVHPRTRRTYSSPRDCLTSAGHLVKELQREGRL